MLVVNGYSTSFRWPGILQQKINRLLGPNVVEVRSALKGGTPISGWIDLETGQRRKPWTQILKPKLRNDKGNRPVIVLAQQSLQGAFGRRSIGIRGANDYRGIDFGAEALQLYANALQEDGADEVLISTHIYKHPMEPEIGNESLALDALMQQKPLGIHRGPDLWKPTKQNYPRAFARDGVHPNQFGAELMAQQWFEVLLQHQLELSAKKSRTPQ
ncbi:SGNH/GDSL hydrolase family protein [Adhaeretor mobilis]|uniref:SGNH/GDSL hydrolase family protein n=1 Tax=Adhaeretor mobilis TaxID=1930276 RepID=UPI0011A9D852|nr:SGNH/GDSL hydrolase family protein [Adhaeretor mobilis]